MEIGLTGLQIASRETLLEEVTYAPPGLDLRFPLPRRKRAVSGRWSYTSIVNQLPIFLNPPVLRYITKHGLAFRHGIDVEQMIG